MSPGSGSSPCRRCARSCGRGKRSNAGMTTAEQEIVIPEAAAAHDRLAVLAALASVYLVWGSTYLAIRITLEALPPFLTAGARFLSAGVLLFAVLRLRGVPAPTRPQWAGA